MHYRQPILIGFLMAVMLSNTSQAAKQDHADIYDAAHQFMLEHIHSLYSQVPEITTGSLDSRLKLRQCDLPLEAFLPKGGRDLGKVTVGVRCNDAKPWSLYVPLTVSLYKEVLVAAHPLERGKLLSNDDVKVVRKDLSELSRGYIQDKQLLLGMQVKQHTPAGKALTPAMMKKPRVINKGQRVTMVVKAVGMEVRMAGKALVHGAIGDRVRVHNLTSKQTLEGTVTGPGEVRIEL